MNNPIIISLCDYSGNIVKPWADYGYECWIVDLKHDIGIGRLENNVRKIGSNILQWNLPEDRQIAFMFGFPPCTHLAVSGRAWFRGKGLKLLADSIYLVARSSELCESSQAPYLIENPISTLSTYWRKPDYLFDPCEYSGYLDDINEEAYTKRTCLWTGGGFFMPKQKLVFPCLGSMMHTLAPSEDRAEIRSMTPKGFSKAIFQANIDRVSKLFPLDNNS